jgi:zeta-carotene desaturase
VSPDAHYDAVVIGGGIAGLSAAVRLASAGRAVLLLEEAPRLGGRAATFTDRDTAERVDNGQHVLFGCYRDTYRLLQQIGSAHLAPLQHALTVTMVDADGIGAELRCPRLPSPWDLAAGLLRWRAVPFGDRLAALGLRSCLDAARRDVERAAADANTGETVSQWLSRHRQPPSISRWLWNPLAIAALNQSPELAAAPTFVRAIAELFSGRAGDASIALPSVPLDELFAAPAVRYIHARRGMVRLKTPARIRASDDRSWQVVAGDDRITTSTVIIAVSWHGFSRVWADGVPPELADVATAAAAMQSSPIVTVNLWLDGPVLDRPFMGFVDGPMHWVFDKKQIWAAAAEHLSIVASGATGLVSLDNAAVTAAAVEQLVRALPAMRSRRVLRSVVVREQRATFSLEPGAPRRPDVTTGLPGMFLAGDWTDTALPATIEGAARSGHRAADRALAAAAP